MGNRKLFCELCDFTYFLSIKKCRFIRDIRDMLSLYKIAKTKNEEKLPVLIYKQNSLMRRKLGNVDL